MSPPRHPGGPALCPSGAGVHAAGALRPPQTLPPLPADAGGLLTSAALRWSSPVASTSTSMPRQRSLRASPCSMLSHTTRKALAGTSGAASSPAGTCNTAPLSSRGPSGPPWTRWGARVPRAVRSARPEQHVLSAENSREAGPQGEPAHLSWGGGRVHAGAGPGSLGHTGTRPEAALGVGRGHARPGVRRPLRPLLL